MPTWLVHGFRWPRPLIRIHIVLQNIDDAAPEWTMGPQTSASLLDNFHRLYPEIMAYLPQLRFIEQYDPDDLETKSHPYAYICDQVHEVTLGLDVDEVQEKGFSNEAWGALEVLRDKIAAGQKMGWFVVVNGDVERWAPPVEDEDDDYLDGSQDTYPSQRSSVVRVEREETEQTKKEPKGFKKWFSGKRRSKSSKDLKGDLAFRPAAPPFSSGVPNMPHPLPTMTPNRTATLPKALSGMEQSKKGTAL